MAERETVKIGVGVWGVGQHARKNTLPALFECDAVDLIGLTTRDRRVREEQAAEWGCRAWSSPQEMLEDSDVEAVYVSTPIGLHGEHGAAVLSAGRHLWCEKALTDTLDAASRLHQLSSERDLALCEAFMYLHHPQFARIKEWLLAGEIGRPHSITARFGFPHMPGDDIRYVRELGGGALLDVGVYPLSMTLALLDGEPDTIAARLSDESGYEVDTGGAALLRFPGNVDALLEWGFGRAYRNELEIWGEEGTIVAERAFSKPPTLAPQVWLKRQSGEVVEERIPPSNHFVLMFEAFALAVADASLRAAYRERTLRQARLVSALKTTATGAGRPRP